MSTSGAIARAHEISVLCDVVAPDRVVVSAFLGTAPAAGAALQINDEHGAEVRTATLNAAGQYTFTPPAASPYTFEVTIAGHRANCRLGPEQVGRLEIAGSGPIPGREEEPPSRADERTAAFKTRPALSRDSRETRQPGDIPILELVAGLALILALAALAMHASLRRQLRAHVNQQHTPRG
jgi:hypothetical protein